jgi:uncharacterized HAD superfamily protein
MKPQEEARKLMAEDRLEAEQVEEKMLERAEEELSAGTAAAKDLGEEARELLSQQRQHAQAIEEKMLTRTEEEIQSKD